MDRRWQGGNLAGRIEALSQSCGPLRVTMQLSERDRDSGSHPPSLWSVDYPSMSSTSLARERIR